MSSFKISNFLLGDRAKVFIIAEIGINHGGSLNKCLEMIKLAAKSGANAVKIQTVDPEESYLNTTKSFREFKSKNFSDNQIKKIIKLSKKLKIIFFSTPGDYTSLQRLINLKVPVIKVSSGLSNNYPLIREIIVKKIPLIISTGLSEKKDLIELKNYLNKFRFKKISILKCTSKYPLPINKIDMNNIKHFKKIFNFPIGYSDHSISLLTPAIAVSKGAKIIEKHFTINNKLKGADHKISLEPNQFKKMVENIRETEKILGSSKLKLLKELKKNKKKFQRVLAAKTNINLGEKITLKNIKFIRNLNHLGRNPKYFFKLENKKSRKIILKNQIINKI